MSEFGYVVLFICVILSNVFAFKVGGNRKQKEVASLRIQLNESMKYIFSKQREINQLTDELQEQTNKQNDEKRNQINIG